MDGVIHTYKARLVAKGYTQTPGINYEETFSSDSEIRAIRILIAIVAYYDYEIWQIDVKTAFLNRYLNEKVYMEQPEGFVNLKYPNRVCKLKRSIYGLKKASRQWNKRFDDEIKKFGFTQNRDKPCVNLKASGGNIIFVILSIPIQEKLKLSKSQGASTPAKLKCMQNVPYALAVGSIMYDVRKFISGLCVVPTIEEPISMYCDNTGAIAIANESGITKGARHFRAKVHYLRKVIEYGDIKIEKVHTDDNLADPFTKALAFPKHFEHTRNIRMLPASSLM
nr:putative zinc finger, CCHC-type [Tanacetum cinerariifolium]